MILLFVEKTYFSDFLSTPEHFFFVQQKNKCKNRYAKQMYTFGSSIYRDLEGFFKNAIKQKYLEIMPNLVSCYEVQLIRLEI